MAAARTGSLEAFADAAYAMLASWGMHRMGKGGAKMLRYEEFAESLESVWEQILRLQKTSPLELTEQDWAELKAVFKKIEAMKTSVSLVANSKVMAHALPNLVVPVDREYTLSLLFGNKQIRKGKESEWNVLRSVLEHFFYPVSNNRDFKARVDYWMSQPAKFEWNTSPLKIVDNLVVGLKRSALRTAASSGRRAPSSLG